MATKKGTKRTTPKKCLQTVCGNTCIKRGYKCQDKDPTAKSNIRNKSKNLVQRLKDETWVAKGIARNRAKSIVKKAQDKTRSAIGNATNRAWVAGGVFKNKSKALVNRVKDGLARLKDRAWVDSNIVRRKFSEGLKRGLASVISTIKRVASLPSRAIGVIKREGKAGIENRAWLATAQAKAGLNKTKNKALTAANRAVKKATQPAKKAFNNLSNNVWYNQNRGRYSFN